MIGQFLRFIQANQFIPEIFQIPYCVLYTSFGYHILFISCNIERNIREQPLFNNIFLCKFFQDYVCGFVIYFLPVWKCKGNFCSLRGSFRPFDIDYGKSRHGNRCMPDIPCCELPRDNERIFCNPDCHRAVIIALALQQINLTPYLNQEVRNLLFYFLAPVCRLTFSQISL